MVRLVKEADLGIIEEFYRRLPTVVREEIESREMEIGHCRNSCERFGLSYTSLQSGPLKLAAMYEKGMIAVNGMQVSVHPDYRGHLRPVQF